MHPYIFIDEHEFNTPGSFGYVFKKFIDIHKKQKKDGYEIKLKGDHYILFGGVSITNLNNIGDIVYGNTVIEIKNENYSNDYTISMQSGHLDKQMDDLFERESYNGYRLEHKCLFVLGNIAENDFYFTKLQSKHIIGKSFSNAEHLIYWILYSCFYNNSEITPHVAFEVPRYRPAWSFLKNVPGVGRKKSEAIIKELYYVHTLEDLMNLTIKELTSVNGIGNSTANLILDYIHNKRSSPYANLLNELSNKKLRSDVWSNLKQGGEIWLQLLLMISAKTFLT